MIKCINVVIRLTTYMFFYSRKIGICNISASVDSWWFGLHLISLRLFLRDQMRSRGSRMIPRKHGRPGISDLQPSIFYST